VEFTIEANPGTLDQEKLQLYRQYGVNRLSLGLQSTFSDDLKMLGRIHSFEDFLKSFSLAREAGFTNINVDLMSAIPGQTKARWQENLRRVAELGPEHISAYSLIVEEGTPFYEQELDLPDEDTEYEMYEDTRRVLAGYGYAQYEISNYARQGAACRHNIGYWQRRDYLGLGLGAASLMDGRRFSNTCRMEEYLAGAGNPETLRREVQTLSTRDAMEEFMFLGLRMTEGVSEEKFRQQFHRELKEVYGDVLLRYETSGHLIHEGDTYRFSSEGIHVSNWILSDFLSD
jgi:oxygen-independent coproporphyrinogen-3 oxidase